MTDPTKFTSPWVFVLMFGVAIIAGGCGSDPDPVWKYDYGQALKLKVSQEKVTVNALWYKKRNPTISWYSIRTQRGTVLGNVQEWELEPWAVRPPVAVATPVTSVSLKAVDIERGWFKYEDQIYVFAPVPDGIEAVDGTLYDLRDREFSYKLIEEK